MKKELEEKIDAQKNYCITKGLPNFAGNGKCPRCGCNVFNYYSLDYCSHDLITGCPYCYYSFCD